MTAATRPAPNAGIMDIAAYVPGKSAVPEGVTLHKLSANETPLGASKAAQEAFSRLAGSLEDYPDGSSGALKAAIAKANGLEASRIVVGNGSDELLHYLAQAYLQAGDEAIYSQYGFLVYHIEILAASATPVVAPETDQTTDVDAILSKVTDKTRMVFLANPNNPTGTYISSAEVRRLHAGLPPSVLLVLDAAYAEYVDRDDYDSGAALVAESENVVMTRTFSKIHGLAGLRVGWMYAPEHICDAIERIRGPFNVNSAAAAAAVAAVADEDHVKAAIAHNDEWKDWTTRELEKLGLTVTPSVGNFVLAHFDTVPVTAEQADIYLTERGFVLRRVAGYGFPNALRMTIGSEEACRGTVDALRTLLDQQANG